MYAIRSYYGLKLHQKWPQALYIAYFQAGTNTYAPLDKLKAIYTAARITSYNVCYTKLLRSGYYYLY